MSRSPARSALFTDLYELTMMQVYVERGLTAEAVFELAPRSLPHGWNFLIAAGLERVIEALQTLQFEDDDLVYLAGLPQFDERFIAYLRDFRFDGDLYAVPEGTVVFPHEPLVQVVAPLPQAQLIETLILNQISFATLIASKASRAVIAAGGKPVIEFGGRRAHGAEAAVEAARAAWIGGFDATSSVEAGRRYGIPVTGTMGHSFILAHDDETDAFRAFAQRYPGTTLLVDTYDTAIGVERVAQLATTETAGRIGAIRIDSGDLEAESRRAHTRLDAAGLSDVRIIVSGGLDEHRVAALVAAGAPIDAYACGTAIVAPSDAPALDTAYKLVAYDGRDRAKFSSGKRSLPARKQVWRETGDTGDFVDHVLRHDAPAPSDARPLLRRILAEGQRTRDASDPLDIIRERARGGIAALPPRYRDLNQTHDSPIAISPDIAGRSGRRERGFDSI